MSDSYFAPTPAPRQLDIVNDTALRGDGLTPRELSTTTKRATPRELSTAPKRATPRELSTAPKTRTPRELSTADMRAIEARRIKAGIKLTKLCVVAEIHTRTYEDARAGRSRTRPMTLDKLTRALDCLTASHERSVRRTFIQSYMRRLIRDFARQRGEDPELMVNQSFSSECSNDPVWLKASLLRRCAWYVLVEGLLDGQRAPIARAAGVSRQAVHKAVAAIETQRMGDSSFDDWMEREIQDVRADR